MEIDKIKSLTVAATTDPDTFGTELLRSNRNYFQNRIEEHEIEAEALRRKLQYTLEAIEYGKERVQVLDRDIARLHKHVGKID